MYNAMLKQTEVQIDGTSFFISPFPVFTAARITAQLSKTLSPVLGALVALAGDDFGDNENAEEVADLSNDDIISSIPAFTAAMEGIKPMEFEKMLRELLVNSRNIAYKNDDYPSGEILTEDAINALFAGKNQNMYILAYHVIKNNFSGFFEKFRARSGNALMKTLKEKYGYESTESSTPAVTPISNYGAIR